MKDDYQPIRHLASGGMAEVVLATHTPTGELHALKMLRTMDPGLQRRILQEGRFQKAIHHPNLLPVLDVFSLDDGTPVLAMPYVDGPDLEELVVHHRCSVEQADHLARQLLEGVAAAHQRGVVHRDLKPENVLLECHGDTIQVILTDFGLAKLVLSGLIPGSTRTGTVMGTPGHMAPEQFRDSKRVDERADVYALGTILYELVCGERCFSPDGVLHAHSLAVDEDYTPILKLAPGAPQRMVQTIEAALSPLPEDRPADASELLEMWTDETPAPVGAWQAIEIRALLAGNESATSTTPWSFPKATESEPVPQHWQLPVATTIDQQPKSDFLAFCKGLWRALFSKQTTHTA